MVPEVAKVNVVVEVEFQGFDRFVKIKKKQPAGQFSVEPESVKNATRSA